MSNQQNMFADGKIVPVNIREEMKRSYIDYAMSVIVGRALPDVRVLLVKFSVNITRTATVQFMKR